VPHSRSESDSEGNTLPFNKPKLGLPVPGLITTLSQPFRHLNENSQGDEHLLGYLVTPFHPYKLRSGE
jgi:hypothetical protein